MPKIIIPRSELPPINAEQDAYFVRYRIITDDRNVFSYWSNIFKVNSDTNIPSLIAEATVSHQSGIVTAAWQPAVGIINYDVWYSWSSGSGTWIYFGRTNQTNFISAIPSGQNKFSIRIYAETQENNQNVAYLLYEKLGANV